MNNSDAMLERLRRMDEEILRMRESKPTSPSSGFNEELIKQAIADAKAVRQTAYLNAKAALEEAFENASHSHGR